MSSLLRLVTLHLTVSLHLTTIKLTIHLKKNWDAITYGSDTCKKHRIKPNSPDTSFESKVLSLLRQRQQVQGSVAAVVTCEETESGVLSELDSSKLRSQEECLATNPDDLPSSAIIPAARKEPSRSRERYRQAARRLAAIGEIEIMQDGRVVDSSFAEGVIHLSHVIC